MGTFVYYTQMMNDGGLIEIFLANENEVKYPTIHGINLFSDSEIQDFLHIYRKTGFISSSMDTEIITECKRLGKKFC